MPLGGLTPGPGLRGKEAVDTAMVSADDFIIGFHLKTAVIKSPEIDEKRSKAGER
jgi:hypothetical protein